MVKGILNDLALNYGGAWQPPELAGLECRVDADPQKLRQILYNLLKNAWESMGQSLDKRWQVSACADGEKVQLEVKDNGPGIAVHILPKLFEPFVTTKKNEGTGLGLAICKRLAEAHGASLAAANNAEGGAVFRLVWPCAPSAPTK